MTDDLDPIKRGYYPGSAFSGAPEHGSERARAGGPGTSSGPAVSGPESGSHEPEGARLDPGTYWWHPDTPSRCFLREAEPGIYHVSAELMDQMMRELGWKPEGEE